MIDLSLERGREVYLTDATGSRLRVCLQPSWALVPGSRLTGAIRAAWVRTQSPERATEWGGGIGAAVAGVVWLVVTAIRWTTYHLRRRRDWTVTVCAYEPSSVKLPLRREPARYSPVRTLHLLQHADLASALDAAKGLAAGLVQDGYRFQPITSSFGEEGQ